MPDIVARISDVTKSFGSIHAVSSLTFDVYRGEVFGLLGPNGAGKSTTLKMLTGLVRPTHGDIDLFGMSLHDQPAACLGRVGAMVDGPALYSHLSALENMRVSALSRGNPANKSELLDVLALVGLTKSTDRRVHGFSTGMRQRLGIALAIAQAAEIVVLDEPTAGLDPVGIRDFRTLLDKLTLEIGTTIILSSNQLADIELLCGRVALINEGRLVQYGTLDSLIPTSPAVLISSSEAQRAAQVLEAWGARVQVAENRVRAIGLTSREIVEILAAAGLAPDEVTAEKMTLQDLFLRTVDQKQ